MEARLSAALMFDSWECIPVSLLPCTRSWGSLAQFRGRWAPSL